VSFHQDVVLLHEAGVPILEVLKAATYNGAIALGKPKEMGAIQAGYRADLVVLRKNPLVDLSNSRTVIAVISRGRMIKPQIRTSGGWDGANL
jgi:imidazolonepropionase-like amidohydrolase